MAPAVLDLFVDTPTYQIPTLADRFMYKKKSGSSDGYHTNDTIET